jgi:SPASM domain peptide maturase of grasp-with-spasm system
MKKDYFVLFGNCVPVKGHSRSIICDLFRNKHYYIPNEIYDILTLCYEFAIEEILDSISIDNREIFLEYIEYFIESNLGVYTNDPLSFPQMSKDFEYPSIISTAIIEINFNFSDCIKEYSSLIEELSNMNCKLLELRFRDVIDYEKVVQIAELTKNTRINSVCIILPFNSEIVKCVDELILNYKRVHEIIFYKSPKEDSTMIENVLVRYSIKESILPSCCGEVNKNNFVTNIPHFAEANNFNSCLNKKIAVDYYGNYKNCPSMTNSYGTIFETNVGDVVQLDSFKDLWHIKKDNIKVCQDCEYRYICMDCRAFLEGEDVYDSKPIKCGYDPYTTEWADWKTDEKKHKAMQFYEMKSLV